MIKNKTLVLSIASIFALVLVMSLASATELAKWNFDDSDLVVDSGTGTLAISDSRTATFPAGNAPSAVASASITGWNVADRYIELDLSTSGYQDMIIKLDVRASPAGPTSFKLQYSSDGTNFTDLTGSTTSTVSAFAENPMHTFNFSAITSIDNNANTEFRIVVPTAGVGSDAAGTFVIDNLVIEGVTYTATPTNVPSEITTCSTVGDSSDNMRIEIRDIKVTGYGNDEEWLPLDEIEVEVEIENRNNDERLNDVELGWGLYDKKNDRWYVDDEESDFNLKKDSDETKFITFKLDDNIDELDEGDFVLYVWANADIDDGDDNVALCESDSQDISMEIESDFVILDNVRFSETAQCGMDVQVTADVWNMGSDSQDDVLVLVRNTELGIDERVTFSSIDEFEDEALDLTIKVPQDAQEKIHYLEFSVLNEDNDIYENDFDDDESRFTQALKVEGGCSGSASKVTVSPSLESGGKAGEELVIKTTLINTGTSAATYTLNAAGYASWATLTSTDPSTLVLNAGETKEAFLKFNVNDGVSGSQSFNIEVLSGASVVVSQPVSVTIESSGVGISLGGNWYLWAIAALNVILVIVIIVIAVRVAKN